MQDMLPNLRATRTGAGLIMAFRGRLGCAPEPLPPAEVAAALREDDGWVWLHIDLIDQRARGWIGICPLPDSARDLLEGHDESLGLAFEDDVVFGVCPDFRLEFDGPAEDAHNPMLGRLCFAIGERLLVTGRRQPLGAADHVRRQIRDGRLQAEGPFDIFEAILNQFCRTAGKRLQKTNVEIEDIQDQVLTETVTDERQRLNAIRRRCLSLHRPVAALLAAFDSEDRATWEVPEDAQAVLQRLTGRLRALEQELVLAQDRARLLLDEVAAIQADEMNRSLRALAVVSTLLLPGALVAGIFGMNTHDLPFSETIGGFWWAIGLVAASTLFFIWILRRSGVRLRL